MRDAHRWRNWGRNQECSPAAIEAPRSQLEVVEALAHARAADQTVKVVGSGHSFTDIACTDGRLVSIDLLDRVLDVDRDACTVTVEAGMTIRRLNQELAERGLALANMGDIDSQTIAGAISTGTHGTGVRFGGLATFVRGMEMVTADGDVLECSPTEEPEVFRVARVGLGALGVLTKVTLQCEPAFNLHHVERPRQLHDVLASLDDDVKANDHFELYWLPHTDSCAIIANNRTAEEGREERLQDVASRGLLPELLLRCPRCRRAGDAPRIPRLAGVVAGTLGTTELTKRSDRVFVSTRLVRFAEMEYSIPREHAVEAILAVRDMVDEEGHLVSFPVEVRFVAPDDIPLSMANGRESCFIAVHMARGVDPEPYFRSVEAIMDRFDGRPHWGKLHHQSAATLAPRYPEWASFAAVRARLDPEGRFRNAYLERVLGTL